MIKDYKNDRVIIKDGLICYFYDFNELDNVLKAVQNEKQVKGENYGRIKKIRKRSNRNE